MRVESKGKVVGRTSRVSSYLTIAVYIENKVGT